MSGVRRVVITGVGMVGPLGVGLSATLDAVRAARSRIAPVAAFDARGFAQDLAGEVAFDARPFFRVPKALKLTDRPTRFAVAAAGMALSDARWPASAAAEERLGVLVGRSGSDMQVDAIGAALRFDPDPRVSSDVARFSERVLGGLNPLWLIVNLPNMTSAHVAIQLNARGPVSTVMSDWPAGLQALAEAREWIANGEADAVVAGGADSGVLPLAFGGYEQAGLFDETSRAAGCGFVPAEGAVMMLLEEIGAATSRNIGWRAELVGWGAAAGAPPHEDAGNAAAAIVRAMRSAIDDAGWNPEAVSLILPGSSFSRAAQEAERLALDAVFGNRVPAVRSGICQAIGGHMLAAAAPAELAVRIAGPGEDPVRILCNACAPSGQAVTLAVTT
jgi:3-oxoacyl-[acyl-carrier-protein] synthase II